MGFSQLARNDLLALLATHKIALARQYILEKSYLHRIFMIFNFNGGHRIGKKVVRLAVYAATA
jgi:hypothetical protein